MGKLWIFVMEAGWVLVGEVKDETPCGSRCTLGRSAAVRVWGTDAGLGQLAREGKRDGTTLDDEPDGVELTMDYVMRRIPCNRERWLPWLTGRTR